MNLTDNEKLVVVSLLNDYYGDEGDCIWAWAHNDSHKPHNLPKTSVSGVLGSLAKKGLVWSDNTGPTRDHTCGLTAAGQEIARELDKDIPESRIKK